MTSNGQAAHAKCATKDNCTGPGCRARTGKTADKRLPVEKRKSTEKSRREAARALKETS